MELPVAGTAPLVELAPEPMAAAETNGHVADDEIWPDADLSSARLARALGMDEAETAAAAGAELLDEPDEDLAGQLIGIEPGQSLEDAIAEYEARMAADEAAALAAAEAVTDDEDDHDALAAMAAASIAGLARDDATAPDAEVESAAVGEVPDESAVPAEPQAAAPIAMEAVAEPEQAPEAVAEPEIPCGGRRSRGRCRARRA